MGKQKASITQKLVVIAVVVIVMVECSARRSGVLAQRAEKRPKHKEAPAAYPTAAHVCQDLCPTLNRLIPCGDVPECDVYARELKLPNKKSVSPTTKHISVAALYSFRLGPVIRPYFTSCARRIFASIEDCTDFLRVRGNSESPV